MRLWNVNSDDDGKAGGIEGCVSVHVMHPFGHWAQVTDTGCGSKLGTDTCFSGIWTGIYAEV